MKFKVSTSGYFYNAETKTKLEKLGFIFEQVEEQFRKSLVQESPIIEIVSLEEMMAFCETWGSIIVDSEEIEIYDDYRE